MKCIIYCIFVASRKTTETWNSIIFITWDMIPELCIFLSSPLPVLLIDTTPPHLPYLCSGADVPALPLTCVVELTTHHVGVLVVPGAGTDSSPDTVLHHRHPPSLVLVPERAVLQTQLQGCKGKKNRQAIFRSKMRNRRLWKIAIKMSS